jgi:hypothetical protein
MLFVFVLSSSCHFAILSLFVRYFNLYYFFSTLWPAIDDISMSSSSGSQVSQVAAATMQRQIDNALAV